MGLIDLEQDLSTEEREKAPVPKLSGNTEPPPQESPSQNPTEPDTGELTNRLADIQQETSSKLKEPSELGLSLIDKDQYGYFLKISDGISKEMEEAQESFLPLLKEVAQKYFEYTEMQVLNLENPFVFSPTTVEKMSQEILPYLLEEASRFFKGKEEQKRDLEGRSITWEESDILGILMKTQAFEALRHERVMAHLAKEHIEKNFQEEKVIKVKEYCTGAGMATALIYESLAQTGKEICLDTVDNSLQSVMCAATLLTVRGIPTRIIFDTNEKFEQFTGVTIHFNTAQEFAQKEGNYHIQYSDNGINYFEEKDHYKVLESMFNGLLPNGLFMDCTLDPNVQVNLSTPLMFKAILSKAQEPRMGDEMYDTAKKVVNGKGITQILQFFSPSSTMQYELLRKILFGGNPSLFWKYLMGAKKAAKITQKLAPKIMQPLTKTKEWIGTHHGFNMQLEPTYEEQSVSLTRLGFLTKTAKENDMG